MTASHNDRARGAISHVTSVADAAGLAHAGPVGGFGLDGAGDDTVTITYPYAGANTVDGGAGTDTLVVTGGSDNNNFTLTTAAGVPPNNGFDGTVSDGTLPGTVTFTSFEKFNVTTGSGNDSLQTGGGNDTVNSGLGTDTVSMGGGSDLLIVDYSSDGQPINVTGFTDNGANGYSGTIQDIYGGAPKVTFDGVETFQVTTGGSNDTIALGNAVSTISTGAGDDSINSGTAVDHLDAGTGNDRWSADLSAQSTAILLDLQAGTYTGPGTAAGFEGLGTFASGSGADNIKLGTLAYNETVSTNGGNDTVSGAGYGFDTVHMGAGSDTLGIDLSGDSSPVTMSPVTADAGGFSGFIGDVYGYQTVTFDGVDALSIVTAGGNDNINVGNVTATISTGSGDDFINSGTGIDSLSAGTGNDGWSADLSAATVAISLDLTTGTYSGLGTASGFEYLGNFSSGTKNDSIKLGAGAYNEVVSTNAGNDTVSGAGYGLDTVHLGAGTDTLVIDLSTDGQQISMSGVTADAGGYGGSIGDPYGYNSVTFDGADLLNITTSGGNDNVNVGNVQSTISTGAGDDFISSGTGVDNLNAGTGNDGWSADFTTATVAIALDLTAGTYTGVGTATGFEYVGTFSSGTKADNIQLGTGSYNETVSTNGGADTVSTGYGNDTIHMGAGTDTLVVDLSNDGQAINTSGVTDNGANGYSGSIGDPYGYNSATFDGVEAFNIKTGGANDGINLGNAKATISTGAGDDFITTGTAVDTIDGGVGTDGWTADLSAQIAAISLDLQAGTYSGPGSVAGIEYLGTFASGSGADNIKTGAGYNEAISTNAGNDTVTTAGGSDTVHMGVGTDTLIVDYSNVDSYGVGTYTLTDNGAAGYSGSFSDPYGGPYYSTNFDGVEQFNITTGAANDGINTGNALATINTGAGDDFITTGTAVDTIVAGAGTDGWTADLSAQTTAINLNLIAGTYSGPGSVSGFEYVGTFASGSGADTITTGAGNHAESISTNGGNDTVSILDGADTVHMGTGTDLLIIDYTNVNSYGVNTYNFTDNGAAGYSGSYGDPYGGPYYSTNFDGVEQFNITTGAANDSINTGNAQATINTGAGDDFISSGNAVDNINAGSGTDGWSADLSAQTAAITLDLQAGTYTGPGIVSGFEYVGVFSTGSGADTVKTASGNHFEAISTNAGNDTVTSIDGSDTIHMGSGTDLLIIDYTLVDSYGVGTYSFAGTAAGGYSGAYSDPYGGGYYSTNFDGVENFNITGGAAGDNISTGDNADTIIGGAGNDTLTGNGGNDSLDGGLGADSMTGGTGNDTYVVDDVGDVVTENLGEGIDTVQSSITYVLADPLENLTLTGTANIDGTGNGADNIIIGNSGKNTLLGLGGNDTITGGAGGDSLDGGANNDSLDGGLGADTMVGGLGNDTFVVNDIGDVVTEASGAGSGTDTVQSSISYTLGANVENLLLTGSGPLTGTGNGGANVITGNLGNNTLDGGVGADTLKGGLGDDTYLVDASDTVTENFNEGTDTVQAAFNYTLGANLENLTLLGTTDLTGTGNGLLNLITGNTGNNTLDGGVGADTLVGGAGNDTYLVDNAADVVTEAFNQGTDSVQASVSYTLSANVENLTLLGSAATGTGNGLGNLITGDNLANTLDGAAGADTLNGGIGDDTYLIDDAGDAVNENSGEGTDTVKSSINYTLGANLENLVLLAGAATGTGNTQDNTLTGNTAANTLDGGQGSDTLVGGQGDDTYLVDAKTDVVTENANEGTDTVRAASTYTLGANVENLVLTGAGAYTGVGNNLANTITANDTGDSLNGATGNDTLNGGLGDDTLNGGSGADSLTGGAGNDLYIVDNIGDVVTEALNAGLDTVQSSISFTLGANVDNLILTGSGNLNGIGNGSNNEIDGNSGANSLQGGNGADTLNGGAGADTLDGGALSDVLIGGAGADSMIGGLGSDTYYVDNVGDVVTELAGGGVDTVQSSISYTLGAFQENLTLTGTGQNTATGNGADNVLRGNGKDNTLNGGLGNDTLSGGQGHDTASYFDATAGVTVNLGSSAAQNTGSAGTDTLTGIENLIGSAFADTLTGSNKGNRISGGNGADTIVGGHGGDVLTGGADADVFRFNNLLDSKSATPDRITDLQAIDQIDLRGVDADTSTATDDAFHIVAAFTKHAGELVISYDAGTNRTSYEGDVNGDKHADFTLLLDGDQTGFSNYQL